ncbi:type 3 dihydrofolate reductase [Ectothiorhodospiraceae bacterium WFHF3C12]|nr:type 3 dihydrofolate reductase [Ectothiorhodospiraceae bacterium WFHF3C12]
MSDGKPVRPTRFGRPRGVEAGCGRGVLAAIRRVPARDPSRRGRRSHKGVDRHRSTVGRHRRSRRRHPATGSAGNIAKHIGIWNVFREASCCENLGRQARPNYAPLKPQCQCRSGPWPRTTTGPDDLTDNHAPTISLIAAMSRNRVIGRDGTLPWRLPADMRHFVAMTRGKPVVMGRKNYEDIGRPLPKRTNIVLTTQHGFAAEGCLIAHTVDEAIALAGDVPEIMVIGGEAVYEAFLPRADRIYLTVVDAAIPGDTWFPSLDDDEWTGKSETYREADEENPYPMRFITLDRRR